MCGHFGTSAEVVGDTSALMPRHFGTDAELVRTLRTQNASTKMV